jgi:hypothetical protein
LAVRERFACLMYYLPAHAEGRQCRLRKRDPNTARLYTHTHTHSETTHTHTQRDYTHTHTLFYFGLLDVRVCIIAPNIDIVPRQADGHVPVLADRRFSGTLHRI